MLLLLVVETQPSAVRELVGIGISSVTMVYRGNEEKMSGYAHEWVGKLKRKCQSILAFPQPVAFVAKEDGNVSAITCRRMDESKKEIEGSEFDVPADLVLLAIGQGKQGDLVSSLPGLEVEWEKIVG